jgi:hypothetical protein
MMICRCDGVRFVLRILEKAMTERTEGDFTACTGVMRIEGHRQMDVAMNNWRSEHGSD